MENQYLKSLKIGKNTPLPDLNLTEDDLNKIIEEDSSTQATPTAFMTPAASPAPMVDFDNNKSTHFLNFQEYLKIEDIIYSSSEEGDARENNVEAKLLKNNQSNPIKR